LNSLINVQKVVEEQLLETVFRIRHKVFVIGQNVPHEEEFDQYEEESFHFLASCDGKPAGVARWRFKNDGVKLERFAVLEEYRSKGVGSALVKALEDDILSHPETKAGDRVYLHAQLTAMGLYEKFNYQKSGDIFLECEIEHYMMEKII